MSCKHDRGSEQVVDRRRRRRGSSSSNAQRSPLFALYLLAVQFFQPRLCEKGEHSSSLIPPTLLLSHSVDVTAWYDACWAPATRGLAGFFFLEERKRCFRTPCVEHSVFVTGIRNIGRTQASYPMTSGEWYGTHKNKYAGPTVAG